MFAKALQGQNIEDLLSNIASAAPAAAPAGAATESAGTAAAAPKEESIFDLCSLIPSL
jgi:ribosomal protein L12E/L44/L45/RPP1/RPP2